MTPTLIFSCRPADPLASAFFAHLVAGGIAVERVDEDPAAIRAALANANGDVFLGGFSRGARLVVEVISGREQRGAEPPAPRGLVLLGYPFHPKGRHQERDAQRRLAGLRLPALVLQGERDAHGNRQAVGVVSERVEIAWLADGNHRFVPRAASGRTQQALIARAAGLALDFVAGLAAPSGGDAPDRSEVG